MPSAPKPKAWKAARGFTYRHTHYNAGDPVTDRRAINALMLSGRIVPARKQTAPAETPEPEPEES